MKGIRCTFGRTIGLMAWLLLAGLAMSASARDLRLQRDKAAAKGTHRDGAGANGAGVAGARAVQIEPGSGGAANYPPKGPDFPHLLMSRGGRIFRDADCPPVAESDDGSFRLPPSVLPAAWRDRAAALLTANSSQEFLERASAPLPAGAERRAVTKVCVLRVDFDRDTPGSKTTGNGRFDLRAAKDAPEVLLDPPPHNKAYVESHLEALRRYYDVMSNGQLELEFDVFPAESDSAFHLPDSFRYGPWIFSNSNPDVLQRAIDLAGDAIAVADSTDPEAIDFRQYDSFIILHAGSDFQSDVNGDSPWDIPSFNLFVDEPFRVAEGADSVEICLVMVVPETSNQDGFHSALNSVIAHEFGHQLGFVDLYDVTTATPIVGAYSLMDSGTNLYALLPDPADTTRTVAVRGVLPPSLDPWHKAVFFPESAVNLKAVADEIDENSEVYLDSLRVAANSNDMLYVRLNLAEYYLLENRKAELSGDSTVVLRADPKTGVILGPEPDSAGVGDPDLARREYDYLIPGEGVLAWHVDLKAINAGIRALGGVNVFYSRPGIGLEEADGIRDIGASASEYLGGPYDPLFRGGYDHLDGTTLPSTDTNDGTPSGLSFTVLDTIGARMRVEVGLRQTPKGWPQLLEGTAEEGQTIPVDLDFDGRTEIVLGLEDRLIALSANGEPFRYPDVIRDWMAEPPARIEGPIACHPSYPYRPPIGRAPVVALLAGGRVNLYADDASSIFSWPPRDSLVTSPPVFAERLIWIGCADGTLRAMIPDPVEPFADTVSVATSPVLRVAAGRPIPSQREAVAWMALDGTVGAFRRTEEGGIASRWSARAADSGRPVGALIVPERPGQELRYLFAWNDGKVEWRNEAGALLAGWPVEFGDSLAQTPIVSDPDDDGELETLVLTRNGRLSVVGWNGVSEEHWPRSIWSEDEPDPPATTTALRTLDVTGDGHPEILVHRRDGVIVALSGSGEGVPGWPLSIGSAAQHGPDWIGGDEPRLVCGNLYGVTTTGEIVEALSVLKVPGADGRGYGAFPAVGVSSLRGGAYPYEWVPSPHATAPGFDGALTLYPNPLHDGDLVVAFRVGTAATLDLDAFDLTGNKVASLETRAEPGEAGTRIAWNLGSLTPGLYQIRFRLQGEGMNHELFRRLAIVR